MQHTHNLNVSFSHTPLVSVIVPTKNSAYTLGVCLESIRVQTYPNIEVIVVDNYSEDNTKKLATNFGVDFYLKGPERSAQRNFGAKKSKGFFLFFVDSDQELEPNVVQECVEKCLKENAEAVIIEEITIGTTFWSKCRAIERATYIGSDIVAARFFKKRVFDEVGCYDEFLTGQEDFDLHARVKNAGYSIKRIRSMIKHHESDSLSDVFNTYFYYGGTWARYIKKHPMRSTKQYILFRWAIYLRHWNLFLKHPTYTLGFIIRKPLEYLAAVMGVIRTFISGGVLVYVQ